ncbi:uncharacterized protein LOC144456403 [Phascolarctos cinereus]
MWLKTSAYRADWVWRCTGIRTLIAQMRPPSCGASQLRGGSGRSTRRRCTRAACFGCHETGREDPADTDPPPSPPEQASRQGDCRKRALLSLAHSLSLRLHPSVPRLFSCRPLPFSCGSRSVTPAHARCPSRRLRGWDARERRGTGGALAPGGCASAKAARLRGSRLPERRDAKRRAFLAPPLPLLCSPVPSALLRPGVDKGAGERQADLAAEGRSAAAAERAEAGRGDDFSPARGLPSRRRAGELAASEPQDEKKQTDMLYLEFHFQ